MSSEERLGQGADVGKAFLPRGLWFAMTQSPRIGGRTQGSSRVSLKREVCEQQRPSHPKLLEE